MNAKLIASMLMLPLALGTAPARATCKCQREDPPVVLEAIVVTPQGAYTVAEWEERQAEKALSASAPTTLPTMVITPDRELAAAVTQQPVSGHATSVQASAAPALSGRPGLFQFLRRLLK